MRCHPTIAALAAMALTGLLGGCGGAGQLDTREVEQSLASDFAVIEGVATRDADCPNQVDRGEGGSFTCTVTVDGQELRIRAVQVDDEGTVRFEQEQVVLDSRQAGDDVASAVGRELGQLVTASCGASRLIVTDVGASFHCEVTDENGSTLVVTAQVEEDGRVTVVPG